MDSNEIEKEARAVRSLCADGTQKEFDAGASWPIIPVQIAGLSTIIPGAVKVGKMVLGPDGWHDEDTEAETSWSNAFDNALSNPSPSPDARKPSLKLQPLKIRHDTGGITDASTTLASSLSTTPRGDATGVSSTEVTPLSSSGGGSSKPRFALMFPSEEDEEENIVPLSVPAFNVPAILRARQGGTLHSPSSQGAHNEPVGQGEEGVDEDKEDNEEGGRDTASVGERENCGVRACTPPPVLHTPTAFASGADGHREGGSHATKPSSVNPCLQDDSSPQDGSQGDHSSQHPAQCSHPSSGLSGSLPSAAMRTFTLADVARVAGQAPAQVREQHEGIDQAGRGGKSSDAPAVSLLVGGVGGPIPQGGGGDSRRNHSKSTKRTTWPQVKTDFEARQAVSQATKGCPLDASSFTTTAYNLGRDMPGSLAETGAVPVAKAGIVVRPGKRRKASAPGAGVSLQPAPPLILVNPFDLSSDQLAAFARAEAVHGTDMKRVLDDAQEQAQGAWHTHARKIICDPAEAKQLLPLLSGMNSEQPAQVQLAIDSVNLEKQRAEAGLGHASEPVPNHPLPTATVHAGVSACGRLPEGTMREAARARAASASLEADDTARNVLAQALARLRMT